jgi:hypothetical protein
MENTAHGRGRHYRTALVMFVIGLGLGLMARELAISAYAQVMDPGQQRNEMNQGISQLNAKMSEMLTVLRTGTLKVRVVGTDKTGGTVPTASFDPGEGAGRKTGEACPIGLPAES